MKYVLFKATQTHPYAKCTNLEEKAKQTIILDKANNINS
jgi:hypothetical protein